MRNSHPIGVFDSGIGGTSIWREINLLLPNENTIYLADSANAPYGNQSPEKIVELSIKNTEYLIHKDCKVIVIACNTATTNAIKLLRNSYDIPFVGIEPAIKPAALNTRSNCIGILATKGTLSSSLFAETSDKFASNIEIIEQVGTGIVELIESGKLHSKEMTLLLEIYLKPMQEKKIDYLVLGCSHYPYLTPQIQHILGKDVTIIDSGFAVAKHVQSIVTSSNLLSDSTDKGTHEFLSNAKDMSTLKSIIGALNSKYSISSLKF
jgi:glutamate racemase